MLKVRWKIKCKKFNDKNDKIDIFFTICKGEDTNVRIQDKIFRSITNSWLTYVGLDIFFK